jgi:mannose-6-phosphate isomerase
MTASDAACGKETRETRVSIERAVVAAKRKPWGSHNLLPWSDIAASDGPIGELWFRRADAASPESALMLKLLFTTEPLSIQVHPDDTFAQSIGLSNGKTEAWYILSAEPEARVAIGLKHSLSSTQLRTAISDGSIADLVQWRAVRSGHAFFVPAGTIHAIGAGIVLAEIQQRSDVTFRLFDYGRQRDLHPDDAVAAAMAGPAARQLPSQKLNETRTVLVTSVHFLLEQLDLAAGSVWTLDVRNEAWIVLIEGYGQLAAATMSVGQAIFLKADQLEIEAGPEGLRALLAYPGPHADSVALVEERRALPEHPRPKTKEVQTWSR